MRPILPTTYLLLLPTTLALGWFGTRTADQVHQTKGGRLDRLALRVLAWIPLLSWLLALLTLLAERKP
jgi:hypothetical protein